MAVSIPSRGELRRVMNLAQMVQSHASVSFTFRRRTCYWASTPMRLGVIPGRGAAAPQLALAVCNAKVRPQIIERLAASGSTRMDRACGVSTTGPEIRDEFSLDPGRSGANRRTLSWYKANVADWADEAAYLPTSVVVMGLCMNGDIAFSTVTCE